MTKFERFYIDFCHEYNLYLNFHIHDLDCKASIEDPIFINIITTIKNKSYDELMDYVGNLAKYINQIKEDFTVARLLLVQSQYKRKDFHRISLRTNYVNALDDSDFNLYIGLLKSSFKEAYSILDKISAFINEYYKLGIRGNIYFTNIWENKISQKKKLIRPEILDSENISLYALYDIYLDVINGYYKKINDIRTASEHERLIIYDSNLTDWDNKEDKNNIGYNTMFFQTIKLFEIVKSSIIYLINFVNYEEHRKAENMGGYLAPMFLDNTQYLY